MKKSVKLFLLVFVMFTLTLSIISTKEARSEQVQQCILPPMTESIPYYVETCSCHGETVDKNRCDMHYGCHLWCYPVVCGSGPS